MRRSCQDRVCTKLERAGKTLNGLELEAPCRADSVQAIMQGPSPDFRPTFPPFHLDGFWFLYLATSTRWKHTILVSHRTAPIQTAWLICI